MRQLVGSSHRPVQIVLSEYTHNPTSPSNSTASVGKQPSPANAWRTQVDKELRGADFDRSLVRSTVGGLKLQPVYTRSHSEPLEDDSAGCSKDGLNAYPGQAPFIRSGQAAQGSRSWRITVQCDLKDPDAKRKLMEDLQGGADGIHLIAGDAAAVASLPTVLQEVLPDACSWILSGGSAHAELASAFLTWLDSTSVNLSDCDVNLAFDPLAEAARSGGFPQDWALAFEPGFRALAQGLESSVPSRIFCVNTLPYHMAGASESQELALALAGVVEILRRAENANQDLAQVASRIGLRFAIARNTFLELSKLRAARGLCHRVFNTSSLEGVPAPHLHAVTSARTLTRRDPWVNMLRSSTQCFAAILGGADAITTLPFDSDPGPASALGRRLARNTQVILDEESHLGDVADPAGGAYAMESYTRELAEMAWGEFQEIEKHGGLASALQSGWVAERLQQTHEARLQKLRTRRLAMTGVSEYANLEEALPVSMTSRVMQFDSSVGPGLSAATGSSVESGQCVDVAMGLPVHRDSDSFEELRDRADVWAAQRGKAPVVFLHTLGKAAQFGPRMDFARNFFSAGGWRVIAGSTDGEFVSSGAIAACICGPDSLYGEQVPEASLLLQRAGAERVFLAGKFAALSSEVASKSPPVDPLVDSSAGTPSDTPDTPSPHGLHASIHVGCNAWQILNDLHDLYQGAQR